MDCRRRRAPYSRARRSALRARGAVRRDRGPRDLHRRRRRDRRAGRDGGLRPRPGRAARGVGDGGRHDGARRRRPARRGLSAPLLGDERGRDAAVGGGRLRGDQAPDARRASSATRTAARSSTTSPAPRRSSAKPTPRSSTSRPRSPSVPTSPRTRARTATSTRSATTRAFPASGRDASAGAAGRPLRRRGRAGSPPSRTRARSGGLPPRRSRRPRARLGSAKTTSRANSASTRGPSPTPTRSGSPIRRSTPAAFGPTWTSSAHSGWSSTRYVWIIPTGRPSTRIGNCRVGRRPSSRPSASRSPPRWARATRGATCSSPSQRSTRGTSSGSSGRNST